MGLFERLTAAGLLPRHLAVPAAQAEDTSGRWALAQQVWPQQSASTVGAEIQPASQPRYRHAGGPALLA